jgi:hypothetical protein
LDKLGLAELVRDTFHRCCQCLLDLTINGHDLKVDQLIKPVQRIPRYTLLLKELRKHVSETIDAVAVDAAIYALDDISRKSEVVIADAEGVTKLLDLQAKLKNTNVINVPHRRLLQQAAVAVSFLGSPFTHSKDRLMVVCSDKIFLLKGSDSEEAGMLKLRKVIDIDKTFIFGVSKQGSYQLKRQTEVEKERLKSAL